MNSQKLLAMADFWPAKILLSAAELGVFKALRRPADAKKVAFSLKTNEIATGRLMDALVGMEILEKKGVKFSLAASVKDLLLPGEKCIVPMLTHRAILWDNWSDLTDTVRFGKTLNDPEFEEGRSIDEVKSFIGAMKVVGEPSAIETAKALDLSNARSMLDIGGGPGVYATQFTEQNPKLKVTILDLPAVCKIAEKNITGSPGEDRISFIKGDVLKLEVPEILGINEGWFDVVFLSNLIHSMGPSDVQLLFAKAAMWTKPGGKVVVKDFFLDDTRANPPKAAIFGINMLVATAEGNCYTWSEVESWIGVMVKLRDLETKMSRIELPDGSGGLCVAEISDL